MATLDGIAFRQLRSSETGALKGLMHVFADAFEDDATYRSAPPSDAYLAGLLAKPHFIAVVACERAAIVGGLTAYILDKPEQDRREVYIYDLAVAESHRRRGIATELIETLRRTAAEHDAFVIYVQADLADAPAIALYDTLGSRALALHFDIDVPQPAPRLDRPGD